MRKKKAKNLTARPKQSGKRLALLDELRGLCILAMVVFHAFYLLGRFDVPAGKALYDFFTPAEPVFAAIFILISGICARFSAHLLKRGLLLALCAALISLATIAWLPGLRMQVWFGILHLLGCSKLLYCAGRKLFDKVPAAVGLLLSLALFTLTAPVADGYFGFMSLRWNLPQALYSSNRLLFLGFHLPPPGFFSWDYFPLLPYFFLFLSAVYIGRCAASEFPAFCYKRHFAPFAWLGKHSLLVYILHIPVLYGIFYLFCIFLL